MRATKTVVAGASRPCGRVLRMRTPMIGRADLKAQRQSDASPRRPNPSARKGHILFTVCSSGRSIITRRQRFRRPEGGANDSRHAANRADGLGPGACASPLS